MSDWQKRYATKILEPEAAITQLKNGDRLYLGALCAEPRFLVDALAASRLEDLEIVQLKRGDAVSRLIELGMRRFRIKTFFMGGRRNAKPGFSEAEYVPLFHSEIPRFFRNRRIPIDVAVVQVSEPDRFGQVSLGISVDITRAAVECARTVIAQVNPRMPRTMGNTFIPVERINYLVEGDQELTEIQEVPVTEVDRAISRHCAELIEDGSVMHVGFAALSHVLHRDLKHHKDLGVHTEMFTDSLVDLIENGVVTNSTKTSYKGKSIATFCVGTRRLYDYVHDNPLFEFHPSDLVLNPSFIASNEKMVSINIAVKVDLRGQIRQGSAGWTIFEGSGGDQDFMQGANLSHGGRSIICIRSTSPAGRSNIVPNHSPTASIIMNRGDVHFVVTEYGAAYLGGKSVRERAMALIEIAHPDHRENLMEQARLLGYIYSDQFYFRMISSQLRARIESCAIFKGDLKAHIRALRPTDESMLRDLFYHLSERSVYLRYFSKRRSMPHDNLQQYVNLSEDKGLSLVVTIGPRENRNIIAEGRYVFGADDPYPDVAIMVNEQYKGRSIGTFLLEYLIEIAKEQSIKGFRADVLPDNDPMLRILKKLPYRTGKQYANGVLEIRFSFDDLKENPVT